MVDDKRLPPKQGSPFHLPDEEMFKIVVEITFDLDLPKIRIPLDFGVPTKQDKVMTEVMKVGLDVFGSAEKLRLWLNNPSYALDDREPIELLSKDSDGKKSLVINELTRVRYGIFA